MSRKKLTLCHGTSQDGFSKQIVISNSRESRRNCRMASRRRTDIRFSIFVNRCISPYYLSHIPKTTVLYAEKGGKTSQNSQSCSLILTILQPHLDYLGIEKRLFRPAGHKKLSFQKEKSGLMNVNSNISRCQDFSPPGSVFAAKTYMFGHARRLTFCKRKTLPALQNVRKQLASH